MTTKARFFDSVSGDRIYSSADLADLIGHGLVDSGTVPYYANELDVVAQVPAAMAINVQTGAAWLAGRYFEVTATEALTIGAAHATLARKDLIVARLDPTARTIVLAVKAGTPAASPAVPALTKTIGGTYEIELAQITVPAAAVSITGTSITYLGKEMARTYPAPSLHAETHGQGADDQITPGLIGAATGNHKHGLALPSLSKPNDTASIGTDNGKFAAADHRHPREGGFASYMTYRGDVTISSGEVRQYINLGFGVPMNISGVISIIGHQVVSWAGAFPEKAILIPAIDGIEFYASDRRPAAGGAAFASNDTVNQTIPFVASAAIAAGAHSFRLSVSCAGPGNVTIQAFTALLIFTPTNQLNPIA